MSTPVHPVATPLTAVCDSSCCPPTHGALKAVYRLLLLLYPFEAHKKAAYREHTDIAVVQICGNVFADGPQRDARTYLKTVEDGNHTVNQKNNNTPVHIIFANRRRI